MDLYDFFRGFMPIHINRRAKFIMITLVYHRLCQNTFIKKTKGKDSIKITATTEQTPTKQTEAKKKKK